jgi:Ca2+:H+ antiporter
MPALPRTGLPAWTVVLPSLAALVLVATWGRKPGAGLVLAVVAVSLVAAVTAAVHHAEVVAHRVGEPFGTLILAVAVTVIEVGLIVTLMISGGDRAATLARDTVFAAFMIVCNGVVGLCLVAGALRHHELEIRVEGVTATLATLTAVAALALVLPTFTTSTSGPTYTAGQLAFAGIASLALYGVFAFVQTVRHRDYFLPPGEATGADEHAAPPSDRTALSSLRRRRPCGRRSGTGSRPASTSRSAPPWRASASRSPRSRSPRSGSPARSSSASGRPGWRSSRSPS